MCTGANPCCFRLLGCKEVSFKLLGYKEVFVTAKDGQAAH